MGVLRRFERKKIEDFFCEILFQHEGKRICPKEDEDSIKMHRTSVQKVFSAKLRRILRERERTNIFKFSKKITLKFEQEKRPKPTLKFEQEKRSKPYSNLSKKK